MDTHIPVTLKRAAFLGVLLMTPILARAQNSDSKAITDLLKEVKQHAVLAEDDAATLESYAFSSVAWQTHANRLNMIREHATDLINEFNQLQSLRNEASPWQQQAIDRVNPLLQEMSDHLTATINCLSENKDRVNMSPYRDYIKANRELMSRTSRLISDFVDYGEAKAKANGLEKSLDSPVIAQED